MTALTGHRLYCYLLISMQIEGLLKGEIIDKTKQNKK